MYFQVRPAIFYSIMKYILMIFNEHIFFLFRSQKKLSYCIYSGNGVRKLPLHLERLHKTAFKNPRHRRPPYTTDEVAKYKKQEAQHLTNKATRCDQTWFSGNISPKWTQVPTEITLNVPAAAACTAEDHSGSTRCPQSHCVTVYWRNHSIVLTKLESKRGISDKD